MHALLLLLVPVALALNVWQITDIHYDSGYSAGGVEHNMCHTTKGVAPSNVSAEDSPYPLVISALKYMKIVNPNPDFILWTGDDVPHLEYPSYYGPDSLTLNSTLAAIQNVTNFIANAFPGVMVFPALGNHDWFPPYQVTPGPNPIMAQLGTYWSQWLNTDAMSTFLVGGYYSQLAKPGLRIVSVNTIFYYHGNKMVSNELAWLSQTLLAARAAGEKVWLISHVPPGFHEKYGVGNLWTQFTPSYLQAISGFSDVIVAQIYGHDHTDSFRFFFDQPLATVPTGYMLLAPSVTPWRSPYYPQVSLSHYHKGPNNPGVRQILYNTSTFLLNDYTQYWANLSAAIASGSINWQTLYSFVATYGVTPPLTAQSLYNVYLNMQGNNTLFQTYANFMSVNYPSDSFVQQVSRLSPLLVRLTSSGPCNMPCRPYLLCAMTAYTAAEWTACTGLPIPTVAPYTTPPPWTPPPAGKR